MGSGIARERMEQMEIIILDTDILIDYFRGVKVAKDYIERIPVNERATTDITLIELFKGARNTKHFEFIEGLKVDLPSYRRDILEE